MGKSVDERSTEVMNISSTDRLTSLRFGNEKNWKAKGPMDTMTAIEDEFVLDEYEAFDDYLEMVIYSPLSRLSLTI